MAGIMSALMGDKAKELEERMIASIKASKELAAELRSFREFQEKKMAEDVKLRQSMDNLCHALTNWAEKAEEIKGNQGR